MKIWQRKDLFGGFQVKTLEMHLSESNETSPVGRRSADKERQGDPGADGICCWISGKLTWEQQLVLCFWKPPQVSYPSIYLTRICPQVLRDIISYAHNISLKSFSFILLHFYTRPLLGAQVKGRSLPRARGPSEPRCCFKRFTWSRLPGQQADGWAGGARLTPRLVSKRFRVHVFKHLSARVVFFHFLHRGHISKTAFTTVIIPFYPSSIIILLLVLFLLWPPSSHQSFASHRSTML